MAERIAAIFAHPDDEVLGAGAALARHADAGDEVSILILATGLAARVGAGTDAIGALREQARTAAGILGATGVEFADFPDNRMDTVALLDVVQRIEAFLGDRPAALVYTHHGGDLNVDHRVVHQAVVTACRPLPGAPVREIRTAEVNTSTEWATPPLAPFVPAIFVDATATLDRKTRALAAYTGEVRDWPHPRSPEGVRALARWRGCQAGLEAAEAFALVRRVEPAG